MLRTKVETLVAIDDIFCYELEYKVLICQRYNLKQAIKGIEQYLKNVYKLKKKERQGLLDYYSILQLAKLEDVLALALNRLLFKALREPISAFECIDYSYISINYKSI